jgi:hypothetical protein
MISMLIVSAAIAFYSRVLGPPLTGKGHDALSISHGFVCMRVDL